MASELSLTLDDSNALVGGFDRYLRYVYSLPTLSEEEEQSLFRQYQSANDLEAVRTLVLSHLRFVAFIARKYQGYGLPTEDLVQEGTIGLMKSVKRFDPSQGVRLATYAMHWIKAEIQEYVLKNWQLVKVATTKAQRKLFFNLRSLKKKLGWMNSEEVREVADYLGVAATDVREMELRMSTHETSIDDSFREGEVDELRQHDSEQRTLCHELLGENPQVLVENDQFSTRFTEVFEQALAGLDERSQQIIKHRWLVADEQKQGLKALAAEYGISMERVRQLELKAFKAIKVRLEEAGITDSV